MELNEILKNNVLKFSFNGALRASSTILSHSLNSTKEEKLGLPTLEKYLSSRLVNLYLILSTQVLIASMTTMSRNYHEGDNDSIHFSQSKHFPIQYKRVDHQCVSNDII